MKWSVTADLEKAIEEASPEQIVEAAQFLHIAYTHGLDANLTHALAEWLDEIAAIRSIREDGC